MTDAGRIPLAIVTGFLGSGKTTLIRHLLEQPGFARTLVIVNEFGEVGIDHLLLEASSDDTILLANGCLCCTIRGNLVDTLVDVWRQREEKRIDAFDRVVVETSGVADPAPLLAFLLGTAEVTAHYRIDALVATCDLVNGAATLARQPEAEAQLRLADRILLTKSDLTTPDDVAAMTRLVRELNPVAEIVTVSHGRVDAVAIIAPGAPMLRCTPCDEPPRAASHADRFRCTILRPRRALGRTEVDALLAALRTHAGPTLLRLKGVLPVDFDARRLVLQGALTVVHEPYWLPALTSEGAIALITEGSAPAALLASLAEFGLVEAAA